VLACHLETRQYPYNCPTQCKYAYKS